MHNKIEKAQGEAVPVAKILLKKQYRMEQYTNARLTACFLLSIGDIGFGVDYYARMPHYGQGGDLDLFFASPYYRVLVSKLTIPEIDQ